MRGLLFVALAGLAQFGPADALATGTEAVAGQVDPIAGPAANSKDHKATPERSPERSRARNKELAKLERRYSKQLKQCRDGDHRACGNASETWAAMQLLQRQQGFSTGANSPN